MPFPRSIPNALLLGLLPLACAHSGRVPAKPPPAVSPAVSPSSPSPSTAFEVFTTPKPFERPRPYPVFETPGFRRAVEHGTRTRTGRPGPRYWTQRAEYRLEATFDPSHARVTGAGTVRYHNRSPDTLRVVAVELYQNANAPGAMRVRFQPVTGGIHLTRVSAGGRVLREAPRGAGPGYQVVGTIAWVTLPQPVVPGGTAELAFDWSFVIPPKENSRMGQDGVVYFVGYWYPQIAVYDDVNGWQADQFMTNAEFYMDYADYDVTLHVPQGWLVSATGVLQDPAAVLAPRTRARLAAARVGAVTAVVAADDRAPGRSTATSPDGILSWHFAATNVRDFAWASSDRYLWDATRVVVGDADGDARPDTTVINAFYRPKGPPYTDWARYAAASIDFLSRYLWPYPWPHMDVVDGTVGGMEYPMLVNITGARDSVSLYGVTLHEIGHMWFPMMVGSDEKRHSWQDEGVNTYVDQQGEKEFFHGHVDAEGQARRAYTDFARRGSGGEWIGGEVELMRHGDLYPPLSRAFSMASYTKMSVILQMLRGLLGDDLVHRALREYGQRWLYRHPDAYDFFNTFNDVSGRDLGWFWRTWFFETWSLDQAVAGVSAVGDSATIAIEDRGLAPMPVELAVTRADGSVQRLELPVNVWLAGTRHASVRLLARPEIVRVEIDPDSLFADIDRTNQVWTAPGGA